MLKWIKYSGASISITVNPYDWHLKPGQERRMELHLNLNTLKVAWALWARPYMMVSILMMIVLTAQIFKNIAG